MSYTIDSARFRKLLLAYPVKAIEFLYESYYHGLVSISVSFTHNLRASEDIVQDTFVHVWEKHKTLGRPHQRSIQYYLVRVVKNKSITYYRRNQRFENIKTRTTHVHSSPENSTETIMIGIENYQAVRRIIQKFPPREKQCLLMKIDNEMSIGQIADALSISGKSVERSLTSANKRLRKYLASKK